MRVAVIESSDLRRGDELCTLMLVFKQSTVRLRAPLGRRQLYEVRDGRPPAVVLGLSGVGCAQLDALDPAAPARASTLVRRLARRCSAPVAPELTALPLLQRQPADPRCRRPASPP